jgi:predicted DNA-binding transcriptional regulator AlpA
MRALIINNPEPLAVARKDACALLGIGRTPLWRLERDGNGPPMVTIGGVTLYPMQGLRGWLAKQGGAA